MQNTQPAVARSWSRLLDGRHLWGSVDFWPARYGFRKYRLMVFPPGINPTDRRLLRLWHGWPMWGALLWVVCEIAFSQMLAPGPAAVWSTTALVLTVALTFALTGEVRAQVRSLQVVVIDGNPDPHSASLHAEWVQLAGMLIDADERLGRGTASPVEHEAVWWQAYERLGTPTRG